MRGLSRANPHSGLGEIGASVPLFRLGWRRGSEPPRKRIQPLRGIWHTGNMQVELRRSAAGNSQGNLRQNEVTRRRAFFFLLECKQLVTRYYRTLWFTYLHSLQASPFVRVGIVGSTSPSVRCCWVVLPNSPSQTYRIVSSRSKAASLRHPRGICERFGRAGQTGLKFPSRREHSPVLATGVGRHRPGG